MFRKLISLIVIITFASSLVVPVPKARAQGLLGLPEPGTMVSLSTAYAPALIKGLTVHKDNPFLFDFIVDTGNSKLAGDALKQEGDRLIKYFFAALTIPDKDLWVNLSPYEKDRMIPQSLGQTAMGRDLLAQDYMLKQLTASLIYPEKELGKNFWDKVYTQAREKFGTTNIPVNTFNKVWIVADKASVYEHNQTAFIVSGHLKVMLEEDYLALQKHTNSPVGTHSIASNIIRQIILPALEHEVNAGKNFAMLRQIFYSQILATWFKRNLKQALLSQVYANKSTVKGVNLQDPSIKEKIYQRYLQAYKKGAYNYIKEETDPLTQQSIPRKYFSGGMQITPAMIAPATRDEAQRAAADMEQIVDMQTLLHMGPDAAMADDAIGLKDLYTRVMDYLDPILGVNREGKFINNTQLSYAINMIQGDEPQFYSIVFDPDQREGILSSIISLILPQQRKSLESISPRTRFIEELLRRLGGNAQTATTAATVGKAKGALVSDIDAAIEMVQEELNITLNGSQITQLRNILSKSWAPKSLKHPRANEIVAKANEILGRDGAMIALFQRLRRTKVPLLEDKIRTGTIKLRFKGNDNDPIFAEAAEVFWHIDQLDKSNDPEIKIIWALAKNLRRERISSGNGDLVERNSLLEKLENDHFFFIPETRELTEVARDIIESSFDLTSADKMVLIDPVADGRNAPYSKSVLLILEESPQVPIRLYPELGLIEIRGATKVFVADDFKKKIYEIVSPKGAQGVQAFAGKKRTRVDRLRMVRQGGIGEIEFAALTGAMPTQYGARLEGEKETGFYWTVKTEYVGALRKWVRGLQISLARRDTEPQPFPTKPLTGDDAMFSDTDSFDQARKALITFVYGNITFFPGIRGGLSIPEDNSNNQGGYALEGYVLKLKDYLIGNTREEGRKGLIAARVAELETFVNSIRTARISGDASRLAALEREWVEQFQNLNTGTVQVELTDRDKKLIMEHLIDSYRELSRIIAPAQEFLYPFMDSISIEDDSTVPGNKVHEFEEILTKGKMEHAPIALVMLGIVKKDVIDILRFKRIFMPEFRKVEALHTIKVGNEDKIVPLSSILWSLLSYYKDPEKVRSMVVRNISEMYGLQPGNRAIQRLTGGLFGIVDRIKEREAAGTAAMKVRNPDAEKIADDLKEEWSNIPRGVQLDSLANIYASLINLRHQTEGVIKVGNIRARNGFFKALTRSLPVPSKPLALELTQFVNDESGFNMGIALTGGDSVSREDYWTGYIDGVIDALELYLDKNFIAKREKPAKKERALFAPDQLSKMRSSPNSQLLMLSDYSRMTVLVKDTPSLMSFVNGRILEILAQFLSLDSQKRIRILIGMSKGDLEVLKIVIKAAQVRDQIVDSIDGILRKSDKVDPQALNPLELSSLTFAELESLYAKFPESPSGENISKDDLLFLMKLKAAGSVPLSLNGLSNAGNRAMITHGSPTGKYFAVVFEPMGNEGKFELRAYNKNGRLGASYFADTPFGKMNFEEDQDRLTVGGRRLDLISSEHGSIDIAAEMNKSFGANGTVPQSIIQAYKFVAMAFLIRKGISTEEAKIFIENFEKKINMDPKYAHLIGPKIVAASLLSDESEQDAVAQEDFRWKGFNLIAWAMLRQKMPAAQADKRLQSLIDRRISIFPREMKDGLYLDATAVLQVLVNDESLVGRLVNHYRPQEPSYRLRQALQLLTAGLFIEDGLFGKKRITFDAVKTKVDELDFWTKGIFEKDDMKRLLSFGAAPAVVALVSQANDEITGARRFVQDLKDEWQKVPGVSEQNKFDALEYIYLSLTQTQENEGPDMMKIIYVGKNPFLRDAFLRAVDKSLPVGSASRMANLKAAIKIYLDEEKSVRLSREESVIETLMSNNRNLTLSELFNMRTTEAASRHDKGVEIIYNNIAAIVDIFIKLDDGQQGRVLNGLSFEDLDILKQALLRAKIDRKDPRAMDSLNKVVDLIGRVASMRPNLDKPLSSLSRAEIQKLWDLNKGEGMAHHQFTNADFEGRMRQTVYAEVPLSLAGLESVTNQAMAPDVGPVNDNGASKLAGLYRLVGRTIIYSDLVNEGEFIGEVKSVNSKMVRIYLGKPNKGRSQDHPIDSITVRSVFVPSKSKAAAGIDHTDVVSYENFLNAAMIPVRIGGAEEAARVRALHNPIGERERLLAILRNPDADRARRLMPLTRRELVNPYTLHLLDDGIKEVGARNLLYSFAGGILLHVYYIGGSSNQTIADLHTKRGMDTISYPGWQNLMWQKIIRDINYRFDAEERRPNGPQISLPEHEPHPDVLMREALQDTEVGRVMFHILGGPDKEQAAIHEDKTNGSYTLVYHRDNLGGFLTYNSRNGNWKIELGPRTDRNGIEFPRLSLSWDRSERILEGRYGEGQEQVFRFPLPGDPFIFSPKNIGGDDVWATIRLNQELIAQMAKDIGSRGSFLRGFNDHPGLSKIVQVVANKAMATTGGIDFKTLNNGLSVTKDANGGVTVTVDPAMIERIRHEGIESATPVIISMKFLPSVNQLLGL